MINPREYVDDHRKCVVSFSLTKTTRYANRQIFLDKMACLKLLQRQTFDRVLIPQFEFEAIDDLTIRITSEYIKGRYANRDEMQIVKDDVVFHESAYSFADYNIANFIVEGVEPWNIYVVDLDSFSLIPPEERLAKFNARFEEHNQYYDWYKNEI